MKSDLNMLCNSILKSLSPFITQRQINYLRENSLKIDKQLGLFIRKFWVYKRKSRNLTHVTNNASTEHQSMKVLPSTNSFMLWEQLTEMLRGGKIVDARELSILFTKPIILKNPSFFRKCESKSKTNISTEKTPKTICT